MKIRTFAAVALACSLGSVAGAQVIAPTTGSGADHVGGGAGVLTATVSQNVSLILPQATALHLDVSDLVFDLNTIGDSSTKAGGNMACVYANTNEDVESTLGADSYSQKQTLPLGTYYTLSKESWPNIGLVGKGLVTNYPPIQIGANGELVAGSKNYFVCYRTFFIQKFSNGKSFDLTLRRSDDMSAPNAIRNVYAQDNTCDNAGAGTGLYKIGSTATHMIPKSLTMGTTGSHTGDARGRCGYKSWLDDLVIVAIPVDGESYGKSTAVLEYTLQTTAF
jgi:hypothetical protein